MPAGDKQPRIPLHEEATEQFPKRQHVPRVSGWNSEEYQTPSDLNPDRAAMRLDGMVVVDCDSPEAIAKWERNFPDDLDVPQVDTARGRHYYYARPDDAPPELRQAIGVVAEHIDIKTGRGNYVLAPGALHRTGVRYEFVPGTEDLPLKPVPERLVKILVNRAQRSPSPAAPGSEQDTWDSIEWGRQNNTLAAFAGGFRRQGMSVQAMYKSLLVLNKVLCTPPMPVEEVKQIALSMGRYTPDPDTPVELAGDTLPTVSASSLGPPPPRTWLWEPYIPGNTVTLASGREGIGKGMWSAWLAVQVATGVLPGSSVRVEPKPVLWLTAEDHYHQDIWPRLRAAGWDPELHADIDFMHPRHKLVLPEDTHQLQATIEAGGYGLVIMDPGRSYFGERGRQGQPFSYNNEADIRPALQDLLGMASDTGVPVVFVGHWRKGQEGAVADRTAGTAAWKQVVRHALDFAQAEDGDRAMWVGKTNLGTQGHVRSFDVVAVDEFDTAKFVLGDLLPYSSLDSWMKEKQAHHGAIELEDETPTQQESLPVAESWTLPFVREGKVEVVTELRFVDAGLWKRSDKGASWTT